MKIKVLGPGCRNCKNVLEMVNKSVEQLGADAEVEYVTEMAEISKYIMMTPGIVVDERVVHEGKPLPSFEQVKMTIQQLING